MCYNRLINIERRSSDQEQTVFVNDRNNWDVMGVENHPKGDNPFGNSFYGYTKRRFTDPSGNLMTYYGVDVGDCVHAGVVDDDETIHLVRQPRPNLGTDENGKMRYTLELPGGFANFLTPDEAIRDEIREETGMQATRIEKLGVLYAYPGISNEQDHIYLAQGLTVGSPTTEELTEQSMGVVNIPFTEAFDAMRSGKRPVVAQTLAAMCLLATRL